MPVLGYLVVIVSALFLAFLAIRNRKENRAPTKLGIQLLCITLYFVVLVHFFGLRGSLVAKGADESNRFWVAIASLYVLTTLGIVAESLYSRLDDSRLDKARSRRQRKTEWGSTIKPILISPMLLIPTVAAFQNANIDLTRLGFPWLMIMLTAFEKGFLWRSYLAKTAATAKLDETVGRRGRSGKQTDG